MLRRVLSFLFKYIACFRSRLYQYGLIRTIKVDARVISVGNISVGGAGKTPMSIWITKKIAEHGTKVALLEKGYKSKIGKKDVFISCDCKEADAGSIGDEPAMALKALEGKALVCVSKDKTNGAVELIKRYPNIQCIVLDDGFQHLKLHRDLNILLMDAEEGFSGRVIPLGRLRECFRALGRADILVFTKSEGLTDDAKKELSKKAMGYNKEIKIYFATVKLFSTADLNGVKIFPVSSIANYGFFHKKLKSAGAIFEKYIAHRDHHDFAPKDIGEIVKGLRASGSDFVVYTSKDAVKIGDTLKKNGIPTIEVWYEHEMENAEEFLKLCIG